MAGKGEEEEQKVHGNDAFFGRRQAARGTAMNVEQADENTTNEATL